MNIFNKMKNDKQTLNNSTENTKIFNGEIFVSHISNENEFDLNNFSSNKSNNNSFSLKRGSIKSNQSNNNERFLSNSLIQDLRGSSKLNSEKNSERNIILDKSKEQIKSSNSIDNSINNSLNNNDEDILAKFKTQKKDTNTQQKQEFDDLYEDVNLDDGEILSFENDKINLDQMDDNININKISKVKNYKQFKKKLTKADDNFLENMKGEGDEIALLPESLRSSGNSECKSVQSINSNSIISLNMRSSNIFNKTKNVSFDGNNDNKTIDNNEDNTLLNTISNNIQKEVPEFEISENINIKKNIIENYMDIIEKQNSIIENNNEQKFLKNNNKISIENKNINVEKENEKMKFLEMQVMSSKGKEMEKEEYVFEKFGKRGWECEKCNNFNFESRTICNRCEAPKQPKSLEQIKIENEQKSGERKKKPLIERKGDWQCPLCHNLNFAFRQSCNRCKLPKEVYLKFCIQKQAFGEQSNFINNPSISSNYDNSSQIINNTSPQLIQNQYNFYQWGYFPMYHSNNPPFGQVIPQNYNLNIDNMNNIGNNKNNNKAMRRSDGKKYHNWPGNFIPKSIFMNEGLSFKVNNKI